MANQYKSIVVAVDGSKEADYAFRKSIDVEKWNKGSILNLLNVIDTRLFEAWSQISTNVAALRYLPYDKYKRGAEGGKNKSI